MFFSLRRVRLNIPIRHGFIALLAVTALQACRPNEDQTAVTPQANTADSYSNDVALQWSSMHLKLVRNSPGQTPPVASRTFSYAGLAMYESLVAGMPGNQSMAGQLQGLATLPTVQSGQTYNWAISANAAEAEILRGLFANTTAAYKTKIDSLETVIFNQYKGTDAVASNRSAAYGKSVAQAIFEWSKTDGGHEGYNRNFPADFVPSTEPGTWRPTENGRAIPMQPYWGKNRTMLASTAAMPMPVPLPISTQVTSPYFAQYLEVYAKNINLSQAEKETSIWWADDPSETFTPPGHSYNLARIAIQTDKVGLGKAAETFARVGIAVTDAFIACWKCKYVYNNERPYTFVRRAIDPNWVPFWPAPPFPGFASGHSTQSAAAAIVLTDLYGSAFAFTDDSHVGRVRDTKRNADFKARSFRSFWEAAEESGYSRFLGGIHTRQDNEVGLKEGRTIGQNINALRWKRIQ
ncbi:vanadium-dependent haloperoxidase [Fibrella forsythiae]|uniref:Vanadium-dependent haloperoxidase n=1 Tax=Fibrella forsythiae TaxID=2817061 RepID=A0ABS3JRH0_9BACT|nr:vanadium-dependent haloperoxidase [Fibrella forsythiae]MBO0951527.1 vanadium-dependent haloperoxidase [Fibrella forsythiae]